MTTLIKLTAPGISWTLLRKEAQQCGLCLSRSYLIGIKKAIRVGVPPGPAPQEAAFALWEELQ